MIIDYICRKSLNELKRLVNTEMKRSRIVSRFVIRRAKVVADRLNDLEAIAGIHSTGIASVGRSLKLVSKLFTTIGERIDKVVENQEDNLNNCAEMWDDLRKVEEKATATSARLREMQNLFDTLWAEVEQKKGAIIQLQDKVDALEKLHTTKIAKFIYSGPPTS
jgi:chromosome segregation ATPase